MICTFKSVELGGAIILNSHMFILLANKCSNWRKKVRSLVSFRLLRSLKQNICGSRGDLRLREMCNYDVFTLLWYNCDQGIIYMSIRVSKHIGNLYCWWYFRFHFRRNSEAVGGWRPAAFKRRQYSCVILHPPWGRHVYRLDRIK